MKQILELGLIVLVAIDAVAQHQGGFAGGGAHGSFARGSSSSGRFGSRPIKGFARPGFFGGFYPYAFPLLGDEYDYDYPFDFEYPPPPPTVVEQPPRPIVMRQAPPPIVNSVIQTYDVGAAAVPVGTEEPTFVIALSNGSRLLATAVWVQDGVVNYIDTDDRSRQVPLTSVERELTRKLNQERNLNLRLPAPQ